MAGGLKYYRRTSSVEETKQLASTLAPYLHNGDAISLVGDLGAGKTHFVQGVAEALGATDPVTSPTFNIAQEYRGGRIRIDHLDLYRLEDPSELEDIDYYRIIDNDTDGAAFVEWADKFPNDYPCDFLELKFLVSEDGVRTIRARSFGNRSRQLLFVWANDPKSKLSRDCRNVD